jgi:hypothetical protein
MLRLRSTQQAVIGLIPFLFFFVLAVAPHGGGYNRVTGSGGTAYGVVFFAVDR